MWAATCSAGRTKKTIAIALSHIGYGLGNILCPPLFQPQYNRRYMVTWTVILGVECVFPMLLVWLLSW